MSDDRYEHVRRARDSLHRHLEKLHQDMRKLLADRPGDRAGRDVIRAAMIDASKAFGLEMEVFGQLMKESRRRPPRRPGGRGRPRGAGPNGPQPAPVRPSNPTLLSGGAEAPLDD